MSVDSGGRCRFVQGAALGVLFGAAYPIIVVLFGVGRFGPNPDGLLFPIVAAMAWGAGFLAVALFEEALFRGFLLQKLSARLPRWGAVLLPSLLFGVLHIGTYGSSNSLWLGLLNASLFGVVMSLVVIRSGSLMGAVGIHWSWNLMQVVLLPTSGAEGGGLFNLQVDDGWWTGDSLSPETGLIDTVIIAFFCITVVLWYRSTKSAPDGGTGAR